MPPTGRLIEGPFSGDSQEVTCPICSEPPKPRLIYRRDNGVGIWQCPACQVMYASPRFTEAALLRIYETPDFFPADDLEKFRDWSYKKWRDSGEETQVVCRLKREKVMNFLAAGDRFLDVGCGIGLFVAEGGHHGLKVEGVEPSRMLTEIARERLGLELHNTLLEEFRPAHRFGGIGLWDVLEHVYDPKRILRRCAELSEDNGYLFLSVPNFAGLADRLQTFLHRSRLRHKNFKHFGFPWHIYSYNRRSLEKLLRGAGYTPLEFYSLSHQRRYGLASSLADWFEPLISHRCLASNISCVARKS